MKPFRLTLLLLCVVLGKSSFHAQAQEKVEAVWDASFDLFFDNREYHSPFTPSQTLFGLRLAPEIGIRFDQDHSIMTGINFLAEFGAHPGVEAKDYIAYYQYKGKRLSCYGGLIPRAKSIASYTRAIFNDSIYYYAPILSGLLLQYKGESGYVEFGLDWNSKITNTDREKFLLFLGSRFHIHSFYAGLQASLYHHSQTLLYDGVVDNMLLFPHIGLDLAETTRFERFNVQAGWMQAFQNDRTFVGKYVSPSGLQLDVSLQKWRIGIDNTLYAGQNLMPYWEAPARNYDYGPGLYWGEPFYRTDSIYNRMELYWQPHIGDRFFLRLSSVHHYDGHCWSWQQKLRFVVNLGKN